MDDAPHHASTTRRETTRFAARVSYLGTHYFGWQRLSHGPSVQHRVEQALSYVADQAVDVMCSGRTDSGVHAEGQVIHFDAPSDRPPRAYMLGSNTRLPPDVSITACAKAPEGFHARYDAKHRLYRYQIMNRSARPGLYHHTLAWESRPLNVAHMHEAAQALIGEHDFNAFRSSHCQAKHARRCLMNLDVVREGDVVTAWVRGNAFLHHMVRNLMGSLIMIGAGERPVSWMAELLAGKDRTLAGPTGQACGLTFMGPTYPVDPFESKKLNHSSNR